MAFQTRSEAGEMKYFETLNEAVDEMKRNPSIWKISFQGMRWRPKRKGDFWGKENDRQTEMKLENLSEKYQNEQNADALYFVLQDIYPKTNKELLFQIEAQFENGDITEDEYWVLLGRLAIRNILSEAEFLENYA